jgi:hypothetical protein
MRSPYQTGTGGFAVRPFELQSMTIELFVTGIFPFFMIISDSEML